MNKTREQIHASLLDKIEAAKIDVHAPKHGVLSVSFADTKTLSKAPPVLPTAKTVTFRLPRAVRIIFTALVPVLMGIVLYSIRHQDLAKLAFVTGILLVFAYLPLLVYYWLSDRFKDKITINTSGIIFKNHLYQWNNILTTHIKRVIKSDEEIQPKTFYYLVLGLDKNILIDINISPFSITGKLFPKTDEELTTFCWWIEHLKHPADNPVTVD